MELFYLTDSAEAQKKVTEFIKRNSQGGGAEFLQSAEWGSFLTSEGEEILRVGVREGEKEKAGEKEILLLATLVKKKIFGRFFYWYTPRGPVGSREPLKFFFKEIGKIDSRVLFLRFEPAEFKLNEFEPAEITKENKFIFQKTFNLQPAKTLILDLKKSETELLQEMHQKTRYNIRLAEKKGVIIREADYNNPAALKEFWRLLKTTGERDRFRLHAYSHYEKLLAINKSCAGLSGRQGRPGFIKLYLAQMEGKNIAGGIFSFYGDKVTYLHGASDNNFRNLMAPYLLQWSLIKKARAANYLYYDFYGIDEKKWPGVTRFKTGFGGRVFEYAGTYDLIFKPFIYKFYLFLRKLRRIIG